MKKTKRILVGTLLVGFMAIWMATGCGSGGTAGSGDNPEPVVVIPDPVEGPSNPADPSDTADSNNPEPDPNDPCPDIDGDGICDQDDDDADGDGFYASEDDCDDLNPDTYPGALDKPDYPGYTDSNCDGIDGDASGALWVAPNGNDAGPGTIDEPFLTIGKGINAAKIDLSNVKDVYAVEGIYNEDAILTEGVGLYGGYGPLNGEGLRERNTGTHLTEYDCFAANFWVAATTTGIESVVEGMTFVAIPDTPALVVLNASPTIRHNKIYGVDSPNWSLAAYALAVGQDTVSKPLFYDNLIVSTDTTKPASKTIALIIATAGQNALAEPILNSNDIRSGTADYSSLGVYMVSGQLAQASLVALKNTIEAGSASFVTAGILMGHDIFENQPAQFTGADIYQNHIYGGQDAVVDYGVCIVEATDLVKLTNNFITGGHNAAFVAAGVAADESTITVLNNSINAGGSANMAISVMLDTNVASKIDNNIFFAESAPNLIGVRENAATSTPASLRNNLFDNALGVKYHDFALGDLLNVGAVNAMPDIAALSDNIEGNSDFLDTASRDYHLCEDSDAIDAGLDLGAEVTVDIDGNSRPDGDFLDIGADEWLSE